MRCCFASSNENESTAGTSSSPSVADTGVMALVVAGTGAAASGVDVPDPLVARAFFFAGSFGAAAAFLLPLALVAMTTVFSTVAVVPCADAAEALHVAERVTRMLMLSRSRDSDSLWRVWLG